MEDRVGTIRVFLLDDHEIVRRGLRDLLEVEPDIEVVGEGGSAAEALARIPAVRPDVAVLDVRLPDGNGVEVCREVRSRLPDVRCLMLTSFADDEALFDAIMAGASGYVLKQIRGNELVDAVRAVAAGKSLLDAGAPAARRAARRAAGRADRAGAADPRADRRGAHRSADRPAAAPGREDGEELRVEPARQARDGTTDPGRGVRRPAAGWPRRRVPPVTHPMRPVRA